VKALETDAKVRVRKDSAGASSLPSDEFWLEALISECSAVQTAFSPDLISAMSDQFDKLERKMLPSPVDIVIELNESVANHETQLENHVCHIYAVEWSLMTSTS
jgi:hypothetical protein